MAVVKMLALADAGRSVRAEATAGYSVVMDRDAHIIDI
jgi:hypothetical protein